MLQEFITWAKNTVRWTVSELFQILGKDGNEQSTRQCAPPTRGQQGALCSQLTLQDHCRGDVSFLFHCNRLLSFFWRYDIFGKYGAIRQIRVGNTPETRGTAFVIYEDIFDAKNACDHLSGFNVCNRYALGIGVKLECNFCDQVSGGPLLPGKQGFREVGCSEEGGRPAEDEGEIQSEHTCPLTHPPTLISYDVPFFAHCFAPWTA